MGGGFASESTLEKRSLFVLCVAQAILLPADLDPLRKKHGASSSGGTAEVGGTAEDDENLTCLTRAACTSAEGGGEGEGAVLLTQNYGCLRRTDGATRDTIIAMYHGRERFVGMYRQGNRQGNRQGPVKSRKWAVETPLSFFEVADDNIRCPK